MKSSVVICAALIAFQPGAWAADAVSPLPAGKAAGLHQAQLEDGNGMLLVAGLALTGIVIALATTSNDVSQPAGTKPSSSTATGTTGTNP